jgi:hypothetical protein
MPKRGFGTIECVVVSGLGSAGRKPTTSEQKAAEIERLTGIVKAPGSLNLRPTCDIRLRKRAGSRSSRGPLYVGSIAGVPVAFRSFPTDRVGRRRRVFLLLVYASVHLRTELRIADGDVVHLEVPRRAVRLASPWVHSLDRVLAWPRRVVRSIRKSFAA